ncbi:uncharacterized protein [Asterias amurensis]|uniref:uncharacterized protein n=1 Tax=Asterias amurensis TaxID=7602 RepID=UPI003AB556E9
MNVMNVHLNFPRKRESCTDCGGQAWNVRREMGFLGEETCVDCGELAGTCQHWLHLYTYLDPYTLMPLSNHGIQRTSLRFHLEHHYSSEIHSDLLETPWSETPLSPSETLRSKFGYRCQFAPVWSSTTATQPPMYSCLEGKITPSQIVTQINQLQTTPSVSNLQPDSCQQHQYPHQQLQQEQYHEQQQPQQQKHRQQKPQSLQRKLQQLPANKPTTVSPETTQEAKTADETKTEPKSAPATVIASIVPASTISVHAQTQSATATLTPTKGKVYQSPPTAIETGSTGKAAATAPDVPKAVAPAAIETGSTGKAAATAAPTAPAVPKAVAPAAAKETGPTCATAATATLAAASVLKVVESPSQQQTTTKCKTPRGQRSAFAPTSSSFATTSLFSRPPSKVSCTAAPESKSAVPLHLPKVETPKPQPSAVAALPAGAQAASTTSSQGSSASQQQSPKQPKQLLSPVTQALDNYLQGISIPSIELSDFKTPPQGKVVLGQGAHGGVLMMVYNNEPVAVKCVPTGDKDTVDREVRILSLLSEHDSFPNLHGTIEVDQFRAVAMQFIGDEALAKCLTLGEALEGSRRLTLDPADWRSIAMNVVDGIKHMHSEGLLHNDIKTDNILMSYDAPTHLWRAYVIDVGVATTTINPRNYVLTSDEKKTYRRFHRHIPPEMVDDAKPQSTQSDIFQLGWVLYFIGKLGAVTILEQLGDQCKSPDPSQRPELTHIRYCIQNNIFI